jgi:8-oxo-dGTP pyrophosphatase MutT (NUDIX family)
LGIIWWGVELEEEPVDAIRREIKEELGIEIDEVVVVTRFDFDLTPMNLGKFYHIFFTVKIPSIMMKQLKLSEGQAFGFFSRMKILSMSSAIAPYDSFAIWIYLNRFWLNR